MDLAPPTTTFFTILAAVPSSNRRPSASYLRREEIALTCQLVPASLALEAIDTSETRALAYLILCFGPVVVNPFNPCPAR